MASRRVEERMSDAAAWIRMASSSWAGSRIRGCRTGVRGRSRVWLLPAGIWDSRCALCSRNTRGGRSRDRLLRRLPPILRLCPVRANDFWCVVPSYILPRCHRSFSCPPLIPAQVVDGSEGQPLPAHALTYVCDRTPTREKIACAPSPSAPRVAFCMEWTWDARKARQSHGDGSRCQVAAAE